MVQEQEHVKPILTIPQAMDCVLDLQQYVEADKMYGGSLIIKSLNVMREQSWSISSIKESRVSSFLTNLSQCGLGFIQA